MAAILKMRHLWIFNHYAQEPSRPGGTRHYSLARQLLKCGWTSTLIAASSDHVTGAQRLTGKENLRLEQIDGVDFLWLRASAYQANNTKRIYNILEYALRAAHQGNLASVRKPDLIIGSSVHPFAAAVAARHANRLKVPFIFEVRDLWPQTLLDMGVLTPRNPLTWLLWAIEKKLYLRANRIVTLLPNASEYIARYGIGSDKIVWISNGVDLESFKQPGAKEAQATGFTLTYFGSHGPANGLDNILKALSIVQSEGLAPGLRVRLVGDGTAKAELEALSSALRLKNVSFEGSVLKGEIPVIASQADGFILCVRDLPSLYRYGISMNKLFDYLASGRPIILASAASNNPVADAGAGLTVPPDQPKALADAMVKLANMPKDEREAMGRRGRAHAEEHYSYEKLAQRLAATLDQCCEEFQ
jgi:glycosyltransferase involved in cell wall biosynthesis